MFDDNVIVGDTISGNAADSADRGHRGTDSTNVYSLAPMKGTVISGNDIDQEAIDIAIKIRGQQARHRRCRSIWMSLGNNGKAIGVQDTGTAIVDATQRPVGLPGRSGRPWMRDGDRHGGTLHSLAD